MASAIMPIVWRTVMQVLKALSPKERRRLIEDYLAFLQTRNGTPNLVQNTLPHREDYFAYHDAAPVRWEGTVPHEEYLRVCEARSSTELRDCSQLALWLGVLNIVSRDEDWVVRRALAAGTHTDLNDPMTFIDREESYHRRFLEETLRVAGVEPRMGTPKGFMKAFLWLAASLPDPLKYMLALIGEVLAVILFVVLRAQVHGLFGSGPAAQRMRDLIGQILIDEVGHMRFVTTKMGPIRIWIVRQIMPFAARQILSSHPALGALFDKDDLVRQATHMRWDLIPADIRDQAFAPLI